MLTGIVSAENITKSVTFHIALGIAQKTGQACRQRVLAGA